LVQNHAGLPEFVGAAGTRLDPQWCPQDAGGA
jgi:hypothetical protein